MNSINHHTPWLFKGLLVAGITHLLCGVLLCILPMDVLAQTISDPILGAYLGVLGTGLIISSYDAYRHWGLLFVGFLFKLFSTSAVLILGVRNFDNTLFSSVFLATEFFWLFLFLTALWCVIRYFHAAGSAYTESEADDPLRTLQTNEGKYLDELASEQPQLVVFLRHSGCTFCREAMADLALQRAEIEATGCGIVLVHVGEKEETSFFEKYKLHDVPRISDPHCHLYRQFGLELGNFNELFGIQVWIRGLIAGLIGGHGIGRLQGNSFQMPGIYLYHCGQIIDGYRHRHAADRPNYKELVQRNLVSQSADASV